MKVNWIQTKDGVIHKSVVPVRDKETWLSYYRHNWWKALKIWFRVKWMLMHE